MASKRNKKKTVKKKKAVNKKTSTGKLYISSIVIDALEEDHEADAESIIAKVKKHFPDSAINKLHISWYRHQFDKKALPKQIGYVKENRVVYTKPAKKSKKKKKTSKKKASKKKTVKKKKTSKKKASKRKKKKAA